MAKIKTEMRMHNDILMEASINTRSRDALFGVESGIEFVLDMLYRKDSNLLDSVVATLDEVDISVGKQRRDIGEVVNRIKEHRGVFDDLKKDE